MQKELDDHIPECCCSTGHGFRPARAVLRVPLPEKNRVQETQTDRGEPGFAPSFPWQPTGFSLGWMPVASCWHQGAGIKSELEVTCSIAGGAVCGHQNEYFFSFKSSLLIDKADVAKKDEKY